MFQNAALLEERRFELDRAELPQTVRLASRGQVARRGPVQVVVQGLSGETVQGLGTGEGELSAARPVKTIELRLERPSDCDAGTCSCPAGQTRCGAGCVDTRNDNQNCGACGKQCPNGKPCSGGLCLCTEVADNSDGGCCPPGFRLAPVFWGTTLYCFQGPNWAASYAAAESDCRARAPGTISCAGGGWRLGTGTHLSAPAGACGYFLEAGDPATNELNAGTYQGTSRPCGAPCYGAGGGGCNLPSCACTDCNCAQACYSSDCMPHYYCMVEPLGPRAKPCASDGQCPPGRRCQAGECVVSGAACCGDYDCPAGRSCAKALGSVTGFCENP